MQRLSDSLALLLAHMDAALARMLASIKENKPNINREIRIYDANIPLDQDEDFWSIKKNKEFCNYTINNEGGIPLDDDNTFTSK